MRYHTLFILLLEHISYKRIHKNEELSKHIEVLMRESANIHRCNAPDMNIVARHKLCITWPALASESRAPNAIALAGRCTRCMHT